ATLPHRGAPLRRPLAGHLVHRALRLVQERHVTAGNGNPGPAPTAFRKNLEITHAQDRGVRAAICDVGVDRRHLVPPILDTLVEFATAVIGARTADRARAASLAAIAQTVAETAVVPRDPDRAQLRLLG